MRYAIVIEKAVKNYSAYVPDLPGCVATGTNLEEVNQHIKEAIAFHLDGLREEGCLSLSQLFCVNMWRLHKTCGHSRRNKFFVV